MDMRFLACECIASEWRVLTVCVGICDDQWKREWGGGVVRVTS